MATPNINTLLRDTPRTHPGIAAAMAMQWGGEVESLA